jgi:hypothetical protein
VCGSLCRWYDDNDDNNNLEDDQYFSDDVDGADQPGDGQLEELYDIL